MYKKVECPLSSSYCIMPVNKMTNNFDLYQKLLAEFVSFKSVSTDPLFKKDIENTVSWLKTLFTNNKFKVNILRGKSSNPIVFAELAVNKNLQTLLIYGHYDVQPADKSDGWKSEPFKLLVNQKELVGRGVVDNKGQVLAHMVTAFSLAKDGKLKYNLKFLIEGNEETGNEDIAQLMKKFKKDLKCDIVVVSDGELTNDKPTIEVSLRGGFNCTLTYTTGLNNLHSGLAGGAVPNAAYELSKFLSGLYGKDNSVSFKEFYSDVEKISQAQRANNKFLARTSVNLAKLLGVRVLLTETGYDFFSQTGLRPTIQISGLKSGYIDTGYSNIIPAVAEARLNFRIVASQNAEMVKDRFTKYVSQNTPKYVTYSLKFGGLHDPVKINTDSSFVRDTESLLKKIYKTRVNRRNVGGAIPFVGDVKTILGVDTLLIPLVNEDCNMHGANENFNVKLAKKALEFSRAFLGKD